MTRADLPLHCPLPSMYLWNSHPKVYLPIEVTGEATCPYCSTGYRLAEDAGTLARRPRMIVVTGGAGFIGSNLVRALNRRGRADVVVVDDLSDGRKFTNLVDCEIADYWDQAPSSSQRIAAGSLVKIPRPSSIKGRAP